MIRRGDIVRVGNEEREVLGDPFEAAPGWWRIHTQGDGFTQYVDVDKVQIVSRFAGRVTEDLDDLDAWVRP